MPPNMAFNARVVGLKETARILFRKIPREFPKFVRASLRKASKPTLALMRQNAAALNSTPESRYSREQWDAGGPGRTKQALRKKEKTYRNTGTFIIVLGPRIDGGWDKKGLHGNIVEGGSWKSGARWHPLTGTSGRMPDLPFVEPAFRATQDGARRIIRREVVRRMQKWRRGRASFRAVRFARSVLRGSIVTGL